MSLQDTPMGERIHIGFFGIRNAGKSSLVNAVTGQNLSIVSDVKGTTTDPVKKTMELLPLGPVVIIDTPGVDDDGDLGRERVKKALQVLDIIHIAVLAVDASKGLTDADTKLIAAFQAKKLPYVIAYNKSDLLAETPAASQNSIYVSAAEGTNITELKNLIGSLSGVKKNEKQLVSDLVEQGDVVVLVTPIDAAAPKGRLILPQQQTIRDLLDAGAMPFVTKETELALTLSKLKNPPKLVITDSQAFGFVAPIVPKNVPLTSFSILFARYKGDLDTNVYGAAQLDRLKDGDTVLISEGCTHHRQCGDIGTQKLPNWIRKHTGKELQFTFTSGGEFPEDLSPYALVVHCGGCMLGEVQMHARLARAEACGVPMTNYGIAIAKMHGILERSLEVFPETLKLLK